MSRHGTYALLAVAALVAVLSAGCAAPRGMVRTPAPGLEPEPVPTSTPSPGGQAVPRPHLERDASGAGIAFGWVVHMDLEGGFWALTDADPSRHTLGATVVVLLPGTVPDTAIADLTGRYVRAEGRMLDGTSIRMAGPEMTVDVIEALAANR